LFGIENCFNSGNIVGQRNGGIFASNCFSGHKPKGLINVNNKLATIYKCVNVGEIQNQNCGGIFGSENFNISLNDIETESDGLIISNC